MKTIHILFIIFFLSHFVTAQEATITMTVQSDTVEIDQLFTISLKLENAQGEIHEVDFGEQLRIYGQPSISNRTSIINGHTTQSTEYIFTIRAVSAGVYPVRGSFKLKISGEIIEQEAVVVILDHYDRPVPSKSDNQFKPFRDDELPEPITKKKRKIYRL